MYKKKEKKRKRRIRKGWNDHPRLGTDYTQGLTHMMSRRLMEHQPLHLNSQAATHQNKPMLIVAYQTYEHNPHKNGSIHKQEVQPKQIA